MPILISIGTTKAVFSFKLQNSKKFINHLHGVLNVVGKKITNGL